jgi:antitoxin CcdA
MRMACRAVRSSDSRRRATNVSLPADTVAAAKELGVNISQACETGLAAAVKKERERRWKEENREKIEWWNHWLEENGLPLAKYRMF